MKTYYGEFKEELKLYGELNFFDSIANSNTKANSRNRQQMFGCVYSILSLVTISRKKIHKAMKKKKTVISK